MSMKAPRAFLLAAALLFVHSLPAVPGALPDAVPQDKPAPPAGPGAGFPSPEEMERRVFDAVNRERAARNLPLVKPSPALTTLAREQSRDMAARGLLDHASSSGKSYTERLEEAGILFAANGENVARSDFVDPEMIHDALMSGRHRDNILHPDFDLLGVGIVRTANGVNYVTQDFIRGVIVHEEAAARDVVLAALEKARRGQGLAPLVPLSELHGTAQAFARVRSEGRTLPPVPERYGETRVDLLSGPDLDGIAASLVERPLARYRLVGAGVHFARTAEHSGGAFFVCVFLLVGDPALFLNEDARVAEVLDALNGVRAPRKAHTLSLDDVLSREARDIARRYGASRAGAALSVRHGAAVLYETAELALLPQKSQGHVANAAFRRVGIFVRPLGDGTGLNVNFLVVLVFGD